MTVDEYIKDLNLYPVEFAVNWDGTAAEFGEQDMKCIRWHNFLRERGLYEDEDYIRLARQQSPDHNPTAEIFAFVEQEQAALFKLFFAE